MLLHDDSCRSKWCGLCKQATVILTKYESNVFFCFCNIHVYFIIWHKLTYLLYSNSSAIGVEWIYNRTSLLHPVVDIGHRDSHLIVPSRYIIFPAVSWPSPRSSSFWLDHECFALGSRWCHPFDV